MHAGALKALEFDRIVEVVHGLALTPLGASRLADLRPSVDPHRVQAWQAATSETVRYFGDNPPFPLRAPRDFEATLSALAVEGRALEPVQLLAIADFLGSVSLTRTAIRRVVGTGNFGLLRAIADSASTFDQEIDDVRHKIEPSGEVADHASPELRTIRERLRKQRTRLRSTLESYLRGKDTAKYLQEQIVTDRSGRYVLVVKSEHRSAIPGIVHGSSASGASLFLEPLSTVEINNDIVALEEQEAAEIRRILLALSDRFRTRALDLQRTLDAATELDILQAKARFSTMVEGAEPALSTDSSLELRGARHPLLIGEIRSRLQSRPKEGDQARRPVPVDITITAPANVLIISGPNTGGKTVALKTAGLLSMMAQAGLHVPAEPGSRLPVFRTVFADIGDEQSIAANLSTFSWHMTNIASMDRALILPALVLLDEIGAGTDPVEGGALATAIVEHFRRRGAVVIATTHHEALKSYSSTTMGVLCSAFGFDPESYAPTYKLIYGSPGRSLALEIAARLGLPLAIVSAAREYRGEKDTQIADHLAKMDQDLQSLEHERRLAAREREHIDVLENKLRAREQALQQREDAFRRRLDDQLEERLREARRDIDEIVEGLKQRTAALALEAGRRTAGAPMIPTGETGAARADARAALKTVADRFRDDRTQEPEPGMPALAGSGTLPSQGEPTEVVALAIGDRVRVSGLGIEGSIQAVHERDAEVDVRGKRLRVPLEDLQVVGGAATATTVPSRVKVNVQLQPREGVRSDLNVIGCTVDEALSRAERFLDEALIAEHRTVRVIHGHGTGQLRRALAGFFQGHPLVARFSAAVPEEGGGGVTVVELKD